MIRSFARDVAVAAFVTFVVVAIVSLAPPPAANRLDGEAHDFAHVLVFGVLGLFVARTLRRLPGAASDRTRVVVYTMTLGLAFGVLTELAQQYLGGRLSRGDVARDVLGTAIGVCLAFALERGTPSRLRAPLWGVAALGLFASAMPLAGTALDYRARAALFPVLLDPGAARGLAFVPDGQGVTGVVPLPAALAGAGPAPPAVHARIDEGPWPGVTLAEPMPDWRGFRRFVVELANPGDRPLPLSVRVNDRVHDNRYEDRFNAYVELPPRSRRRIAYPIADIEAAPRGRRMNLAEIEKIVVFHAGPAPGRDFYLLKLELER
ncbi:MAG: VanZ family protein [Steroidobacteraceae bacterium]|jgi:VanZ family protein|nr:VanZ family protein [Steroidobacteraceae bacterium]